MRQRKIKNVDEKLKVYASRIIDNPAKLRGHWKERFSVLTTDTQTAQGTALSVRDDIFSLVHASAQSEASSACAQTVKDVQMPVHSNSVKSAQPPVRSCPQREEEQRAFFLEIGSGKGQFLTRSALADPQNFYIGAEGLTSALLRCVEKAEDMELHNVRYINGYMNDLNDCFIPGELDGIFLNFSDPWPKLRHEKRRLTCGFRLLSYLQVLKTGGFLRFKTDNHKLMEYTRLQVRKLSSVMPTQKEIRESAGSSLKVRSKNGTEDGARGPASCAFLAVPPFVVSAFTNDLEHSSYRAISPRTEYEEKFIAQGKPIAFLELRRV